LIIVNEAALDYINKHGKLPESINAKKKVENVSENLLL